MRLFQVCFRRHSYEVCIDIIESAPEQNYREAEEHRSETYNHSFLPDIEHRYLRVTRRMICRKSILDADSGIYRYRLVCHKLVPVEKRKRTALRLTNES